MKRMCHQLLILTNMNCSHTHADIAVGSICHTHSAKVICLYIHAQDRLYLRIPEWLVSLEAYLDAKVRVHVQRKEHFPRTPE